ncbi:hypothetical protein SISSUDRAFT_75231 [Sistotremastrum suecicum HHB10207 ss-3]|uniref:Uncharacterized protein n=1 Tax=Sistotremastrum suecicum HHB10207 ss-3 TaxID=1314776 RepID=A0A166BDS3_9AGAM|nr:hypothetical protein SISSUDRAFT_75231 [Sistotremastrum suecicum HHB10207 ss-3]
MNESGATIMPVSEATTKEYSRVVQHLSYQVLGYSDYPSYEPRPRDYRPELNYYIQLYHDRSVTVDEYIHERFCSIFPVHNWAHDHLIRALIFSRLCAQEYFMSIDEVVAIFVLSKDLRIKAPNDIWLSIAPHLINQGIEGFITEERPVGTRPEMMDLTKMSPFARSQCVSFANLLKSDPEAGFPPAYDFISEIRSYVELQDEWDWGMEETWNLPHIRRSLFEHSYNQLPPLKPELCVCGKCKIDEERLEKNNTTFRKCYQTMIEDGHARGCTALQESWEPFMEAAEEWLEDIGLTVQATGEAFYQRAGERKGPATLDTANALHLHVGSELQTRDRLRIVSTLRSPTIPTILSGDLKVPLALSSEDVGYLIIYRGEVELITSGNWLPELDEKPFEHLQSQVYVLSTLNDCTIRFDESKLDERACLPYYPSMEEPWYLPNAHDRSPSEEWIVELPDASTRTKNVIIECSRRADHGYPLFSMAKNQQHHGQALQLKASYQRRTFETWWRPVIVRGRRCPHSELYQKGTRCSLAAKDVLLQLKRRSDRYTEECDNLRETQPTCRAFGGSCISEPDCRCTNEKFLEARERWREDFRQTLLGQFTRQHQYILGNDGPFSRHNAIIVRCPDPDALHPLIFLSASCGRRIYLINYQECWDCACERMIISGCSVGIDVTATEYTTCVLCQATSERAAVIAQEILESKD